MWFIAKIISTKQTRINFHLNLCNLVLACFTSPLLPWCEFREQSAMFTHGTPDPCEKTKQNSTDTQMQELECFCRWASVAQVCYPASGSSVLWWKMCAIMCYDHQVIQIIHMLLSFLWSWKTWKCWNVYTFLVLLCIVSSCLILLFFVLQLYSISLSVMGFIRVVCMLICIVVSICSF